MLLLACLAAYSSLLLNLYVSFIYLLLKLAGNNPFISAIFYTLATVWLTGAFHEDGLADTFDSFGGGWGREQILLIMKDSRIGTYGAIGFFWIWEIS